jgi:formylmethanofuran dehydrogenase subunit E
MGLAVPSIVGMDIPRSDKKLVVFLETDGCFADGIAVSTGCTVGHRTLRIEDYGKVAATFVQVDTGFAVRLSPMPDVREHSWGYAPNQKTHYYAQLYGYQVMPLKELFSIQEVTLTESIETILSHPGGRTNCDFCGEEIINERQLQIQVVGQIVTFVGKRLSTSDNCK